MKRYVSKSRLNKAALDHAIYAPLGTYLRYYAWRRNVSGIVPGPAAVLLGSGQDGLMSRRRTFIKAAAREHLLRCICRLLGH